MLGRKRIKLAHRFTLVFSLVICSITGILSVLTEAYTRKILIQHSEERVASLGGNLAAVARPHLLNYNYIELQRMADAMIRETEVAFAIILDKEGNVAGYSGNREVQGTRPNDLRSVQALAAPSEQISRQEWESMEGVRVPVVEATVPVMLEDGGRWGTVRIGLSLKSVLRKIMVTRMILLLFACAGIAAAVLASHILARRITLPLRRLVGATMRLERGEWDPGFSLETGDEIGDLAQIFSGTAESLERQKRQLIQARDELKSLNATLEEKVEQRTAELKASREKYRLLVEGSPDGFVLLDADRILFANSAFENIFEHSVDQIEDRDFSWTKVIHRNFHSMAAEQLRKAERSFESFRADWVGFTRSGRTPDLEVRGRGVEYQGKRAVELVLTDVSEKRRLLRQVVQNERLRAMGEMTAMVAHHFNNILAIIHGRAQLLQRSLTNERLRGSLQVIQASVIKAGEMVRHLQDYYGEHVDLRFVEIDVNELIEEVATYQERLWRTTRPAETPPITIRLELRDIPPVRGADPLLQDAFRRILVNAAEAMPDGGVIVVSTSSENGSVTIRIQDPGVGMESEVAKRAFDPFFTTKGPSTRGLGLSASVGILQRHEGMIRLESEVGKGTTVLVTLPIESRLSKIVPLDNLQVDQAGSSKEKLG